MPIGAHVSTGGGLDRAVERGIDLRCESIQIFHQNPRMWKPTRYEAADFDALVIPGGFMPDKLRRDPHVLDVVRDFAAAGKPTAAMFRNVRLIVSAFFPDEWEEWARAHGIDPPALGDPIMFDAPEQALQLAENGHGMAMGRRPVVDAWLESGRLVAPFSGNLTGAAYYLCRPADVTPTAAARRTERWLSEAAAAWRVEREA